MQRKKDIDGLKKSKGILITLLLINYGEKWLFLSLLPDTGPSLKVLSGKSAARGGGWLCVTTGSLGRGQQLTA